MTTENSTHLENALHATIMNLWEMQTKNYDVQKNHMDLLSEISVKGKSQEDLVQEIDQINDQCRKILTTEKPPQEPRIARPLFDGELAPVPNNTIVEVFIQAICCGGKNACHIEGGWEERGKQVIFEKEIQSGGKIIISLEKSKERSAEDAWKFVENLSLLTVDVALAVLVQICKNFRENHTNRPTQQITRISSALILKALGMKSRRDAMKQKIAMEIEKIGMLQIKTEGLRHPTKPNETIDSRPYKLFYSEDTYRKWNKTTLLYYPRIWDILPGEWANIWLRDNNFFGKLSKELFQLDYRIKKPEHMAKKIGYLFFTIPGGTYYLKNGVHKEIRRILNTIGGNISSDSKKQREIARHIDRMYNGIERLEQKNLIEPIMDKVVRVPKKPHNINKRLAQMLKINISEKSGIAPTKSSKTGIKNVT